LAGSLPPLLPWREPEPWSGILERAEPYAKDSKLAEILARDAGWRRGFAREASASACGPGISARILLECVEPGEADALGAPGRLGYVPVVIKDNMDHPRFKTRLGAPYAEHTPTGMDPLTRALASVGAAVVGKASMHELALGTTNVNPHYGTPENPACPGRITGGSSGGSAAAVAAGIAPLATGNDAGGSVRLPAAFTGVTGFKSSRGYLPGAGKPPIPSVASSGLIARTPLDIVLALDALDPGIATAAVEIADALQERPPRILVPRNLLARAEGPVHDAFNEVVETLKSSGLSVEFRDIMIPDVAERARVVATLAEAFNGLSGIYREHREEMGEDIRFLLDIASSLPSWSLESARHVLRETRTTLNARLQVFDAILLPTAPVEPPRVEEADWRLSASTRLIEFTAPFNILDLPALSMPAPPRLPCGVQVGVQIASGRGEIYLLGLALSTWKTLWGED